MIASLRFFAICLVATLGFVSFKIANNGFNNVRVSGGLISGTVNKVGDIHIFKGIPFADTGSGLLKRVTPMVRGCRNGMLTTTQRAPFLK